MKNSELVIGMRVVDHVTRAGETGTVEEFRSDGEPLVRWDYGQLLRSRVVFLEPEEK